MRICLIDDEADCDFPAQKLIEKFITDTEFLHFNISLSGIISFMFHRFSLNSKCLTLFNNEYLPHLFTLSFIICRA